MHNTLIIAILLWCMISTPQTVAWLFNWSKNRNHVPVLATGIATAAAISAAVELWVLFKSR